MPQASTGVSLIERLGIKPPTNTGLRTAPFQATGKEGIVGGALKTVGNVPSSAIDLGKNVMQAVTNPIDTGKTIIQAGVGAASKLGRKLGTGKNVDQPETPEEEVFGRVTSFIKDRYGDEAKLKETIIEDPVGVLADFASVFTGAGAATKVPTLSKIGKVTEPVKAISSTIGKTKEVIADSKVGKIASDISPTSKKMQQGQVTKALEFTPGDLSSITQKTGNDPTEFIIRKNAIKDTPEETAHALEADRKVTKQQVRDSIAQVTKEYTPEEVPAMKEGMKVILAGVDEVPGLENVAGEIKALAQQEKYTLSDVQKAKELIDDNSDIYSKLGDVKSSATARGLDNIRKDLKKFIEDEVDLATEGKVDIRSLNNDVQTNFAIQEAIENRVAKGQSRQYLSAFDGIIGLGAYSQFGLVPAVAIVVGKKIAQSPTFRLTVAKALSKIDQVSIKKLSEELSKNNLSPESKALIKSILEEANKNAPYIESGANILEEAQNDEI